MNDWAELANQCTSRKAQNSKLQTNVPWKLKMMALMYNRVVIAESHA